MSRQNWGIGLLFLLALMIWRWFSADTEDQSLNHGAIYQPSFTASQLRTQHYDAAGNLKEELQADYAGKFAAHRDAIRSNPAAPRTAPPSTG